MACILNIGFAVFCIMAAATCGASPTPDTVTEKRNVDTDKNDDFLRIPSWLRSAVESIKPLVVNNNVQENINKENPFVRSKRSTCPTPSYLPQLLRDLNTQLNHSQYIGNPGDTITPTQPAPANYTCPTSATGDWWPGTEDRLTSTCPWNLERVDLGENAFPRYVMNAVCMCSGCLNSPDTTRCTELQYNLTYFERKGCHKGLALMETSYHTLSIGCFCRVASPNSTPVANSNNDGGLLHTG